MLLCLSKGSSSLKEVRMAADSFWMRARSSAYVLHARMALMSARRFDRPREAMRPPRRGSSAATCCDRVKRDVMMGGVEVLGMGFGSTPGYEVWLLVRGKGVPRHTMELDT